MIGNSPHNLECPNCAAWARGRGVAGRRPRFFGPGFLGNLPVLFRPAWWGAVAGRRWGGVGPHPFDPIRAGALGGRPEQPIVRPSNGFREYRSETWVPSNNWSQLPWL